MTLQGLLAAVFGAVMVSTFAAQAPSPPSQLNAVTHVQRTPERFELREIQTRRTVGGNVEVIGGLRDGERIVVRGADKMPRQ